MFVFLQKILPKHLLSRIVGLIANCEWYLVRRVFIGTICFFYDIDLTEAERTSTTDYRSFNDFFTRSLKPGARVIRGDFCSPADGTVASMGDVHHDTIIQSKNHHYSLSSLILETGDHFNNGSFITVYLAPHNYHRVHLPCEGKLMSTRYVPGELFSVNQTTASELPDLFARNERLVCHFDTPDGRMALVMVGAMLVAAIKPIWLDDVYAPGTLKEESLSLEFHQGDELGQFEMGSTVILVTEKRLNFAVVEGQPVQMGESLTL